MHIFSIGECMVELSSSKDGKYNLDFAGDTANTAVYLSRLGAKTSYITSVGKDSLSKKMIEYYDNYKNYKLVISEINVNVKNKLIINECKGIKSLHKLIFYKYKELYMIYKK